MFFEARLREIPLRFETSPCLFSPRAIDAGTAALLERVDLEPSDRVLDLGCGYGVVGIVAARLIGAPRVVMSDVDPEAVRLATLNSARNGVQEITVRQSHGFRHLAETGFTKILCNPPYHSDFSLAKELILKGFNRLALGGSMFLVVKRRLWYENKLRSTFGGVETCTDGAYSILRAERRSRSYASGPRRTHGSRPCRPSD